MKNRSNLSRVDQADFFDSQISDMLKVISNTDTTPIEDLVSYNNLSLIFLREIMTNTAIIADYCKAHSIPVYPNKCERRDVSDKSKDINC